jgi:crossover junction endodeoxyribonuclease RuvC
MGLKVDPAVLRRLTQAGRPAGAKAGAAGGTGGAPAGATLRVLGIDPGLRLTGYGVVDLPPRSLEPRLIEGGVIRLALNMGMEGRLHQLHQELIGLITELKPHCLAVEKLYSHYAHPRTAILMAHARGVILLAARQHNLGVEHLPSTAVKKAITGRGHASKEQMQRAVQSQFHLKELPSPPDVADAIAIATTHARRIALARA